MELVRQFCFSHGLLGEKTKSADDVAIQFPDGSVLGKAGSRAPALQRRRTCRWPRRGKL